MLQKSLRTTVSWKNPTHNEEDAKIHDAEGEDLSAKPACSDNVNIPKRNKWKGIPSDVLKSPYFHSVELKKGNKSRIGISNSCPC